MSLAAGTTALMSSCDLVKDFTYTVNPNPLEMHGDNVKFTVVVNVPEKGLNKKVKAEITPKLGNTAIGTWVLQGEKITGNGQTITFKPGGSATFDLEIPYRADMEATDLKITGKIFKGTKEKGDIPELKIADATVITPLMVRKEFKVLFEKDAIVRETVKSTSATINYDKAKSIVKPNELKEYRKKWYSKNKQYWKDYRSKNIDKQKEYSKNYYLENKNVINQYTNKWRQNKTNNDPIFRLINSCRSAVNRYLKNKKDNTMDIIGCSPEFLKEHLEKQFKDGMSWDNHTKYGWHIDHIIPLSSAKTEEEIYELCYYTNLQPLWAVDNLRKKNYIEINKKIKKIIC
jgi:hypothetical protein